MISNNLLGLYYNKLIYTYIYYCIDRYRYLKTILCIITKFHISETFILMYSVLLCCRVSRKVVRRSRHWQWLRRLLWQWRKELLFLPEQQSVTIIGDGGYRFCRHGIGGWLAADGLCGYLATNLDGGTSGRNRHFHPVRGTTTTRHVGHARVRWSRTGQTACHHYEWFPDDRGVQRGRGTMPATTCVIHVRSYRQVVFVDGIRTWDKWFWWW